MLGQTLIELVYDKNSIPSDIYEISEEGKTDPYDIYKTSYTIKVSNDSEWYKEIDPFRLYMVSDNKTVNILLEYKEIADGNEEIYVGEWVSNPTFIFDGGVV